MRRACFLRDNISNRFEETIGNMTTRSGIEKAQVSAELGAASGESDSVQAWRSVDSTAMLPHLAPRRNEPASKGSHFARWLGRVAGLLTIAAILASAVLLLSDARPSLESLFRSIVLFAPKAWAWLGHAPLSALPLLLAGASYVVLQAVLRPPPMELLRRLMLGSAFLLWGIVQLMPAGTLATNLGDVVITLYVIDLGLMVQAELQAR
jgi:hypothetical protein